MAPRAGLDGRKISSPPGFDPGPSSPLAQSLYRLSYPAHSICDTYCFTTATLVTRTHLNVNVIRTLHVCVMYTNLVECAGVTFARHRVWRTITESYLLDNFVTLRTLRTLQRSGMPHAQDNKTSCQRKLFWLGVVEEKQKNEFY